MIFGEYYHSMDKDYGYLEPTDISPDPRTPVETSGLGPQEVGTSTNPMAHQVQSFSEKIRAGASKIELSFLGQGKTNSQQPGPEAFGNRERRDIRELAEMNEIKTSVHASWHTGSLAGFGREGFNEQLREQAIIEIEKAIHFAAEATKGGAVVFHTGEWNRPLTELSGGFEAYPHEKEKTPIVVVDSQTGDITAVRRDQLVFEPAFYTAKEYEPEIKKKLVGTIDKNGNKIEADDWVDIDGTAIKREWVISKKEDEIERLFNRMPKWNQKKTKFDVDRRNFKYFVKEADKIKEKTGEEITPEELFYKSQLADHVSQAKGQSLYYAQYYERHRTEREAAKKALEYYEKLESSLSPEEKWKILVQKRLVQSDLVPLKNMLPSEYLKEEIKQAEDQMRYVHEGSASADARAREAMDRMQRVTTVENYGLKKTSETIADLGLKAMRYTDAHRKELNEPIFVAPENWTPEQYGSHPDEIRKIVEESRDKMAQQLVGKEGYSKEEAKEKAKEHIKATIDVCHFNTWRQHFNKKDDETPQERDKRFNKWLLDETKKLAKDGIIGHIHLTDNFGYDDEHLTPGEGNVPMKDFIKNMEAAGLKDFIAEAGSFNANTVMQDAWAFMGSPIYSTGRFPTFRSVRDQHFGYHNPSTYIVGAYAPSNEWRLWSEVPME